MQDPFQEGSICVPQGYSGKACCKCGSLLRKQNLTISSWNLQLQVSVQDCSAQHGRNSQGQGVRESSQENGILSQWDWLINVIP